MAAISGRQVLLFHASARDELTPPLHRTPPGQHAGSPATEDSPKRDAFVPGIMYVPGCDVTIGSFDASAVVHACSSSRRIPGPSQRAFSVTLTSPALNRRSVRGFGFSTCIGEPGGPEFLHHWHSTVRNGDLLHHHHSPFRTHYISSRRRVRVSACGGYCARRAAGVAGDRASRAASGGRIRRMSVQLVRSSRLFPGVPYAYAAVAGPAGLAFTARARPLDEHGQVTPPRDAAAQA